MTGTKTRQYGAPLLLCRLPLLGVLLGLALPLYMPLPRIPSPVYGRPGLVANREIRRLAAVASKTLVASFSPEFVEPGPPRQVPVETEGIILRFFIPPGGAGQGLVERGCLAWYRGVVDREAALASAAIEAARHDRRYRPISRDELPNLVVELCILGPWRDLESFDSFDLHSEALFMDHPLGTVMMQPSLAVDGNWSLEQLLEALCRKEGLSRGAWADAGVRFRAAPAAWVREAVLPGVSGQRGAGHQTKK